MAAQSASVAARGRSTRGSIHTPLSPANVQDLKAKFDLGNTANGTTLTSANRSKGQERKEQVRSPAGTGVEVATTKSSGSVTLSTTKSSGNATLSMTKSSASATLSTTKSSGSVTLSSLSSSLHAAAQRQLGSSTCSTSSTSSVVSPNLRSTVKPSTSTSSTTSTRPFSPSSLSSYKSMTLSSSGRSSPCTDASSKVVTSSKSVTLSSSGRSSPCTDASSKVVTSSKSVTRPASSTVSAAIAPLSSPELKNTKLDGPLELSVMQTSTSGSEVSIHARPRSSTVGTSAIIDPQTDIGLSYIIKRTPERRSAFDSGSKSKSPTEKHISQENSPPVQRSNRIVAREIKLQQSDSRGSLTSYRDSFTTKAANTTSAPSTATATTTANTTATPKTTNTISTPNIPSGIVIASTIKSSTTTASTKLANTTSTTTAANTTSTTTAANTSATIKPSHTTSTTKLPNSSTSAKTAENISLEARVGQVTTGVSSNTTTILAQPEFSQVKLRKARSGQSEGSSSARGNLNVANSVEEKRISCKINSQRFERLMFDFQRGVPSETIVRRGSETDHIALQQKARELSKPALEDDVPVISKKKKEPSIFTEGLKVSDFVKQVNKLNPETEAVPKWKVQRATSQTSSAASSDVGGDNFYQGIPGEDPGVFSDDNDDIYEKVTNRAVSSTDGEHDGLPAKTSGRTLGVYRKQRGSKKTRPSSSKAKKENEKASQSDGSVCESGDWSSSGTEYEDMSPDGIVPEGEVCLYEDLNIYSKPARQASKNKTITHKLKNMFSKGGTKNKKSKSLLDSAGMSGGTESEADTVDDMEETDNDLTEGFSRTSSERSGGHLTRDSAAQHSLSLMSTEETTLVGNPTASMPPAPRLPPRTTKNLSQTLENSPPLPPRNACTSSKAQDTAMPTSPTGKLSSDSVVDKSRNILPGGGTSQDGFETETAAAPGKTEYTDLDPAPAVTMDKLERSDSTSRKRRSLFGRKTGGNLQSAVSTSTSASSSTNTDVTGFPEMKGYDASLYVDLEDAQVYGKTSDFYVSKFESQPLYQWYSKDKVIQNMCSDKSTSDDLSSDDEYLEDSKRPESLYEDVEKLLERANSSSCPKAATTSGSKSKRAVNPDLSCVKDKPERRSVIEEVFKKGGSLHRALWCQMPEVIESGILEQLTDGEKKVQEAMFEIITSEASYLKSLKVLISVFLMAPEFSAELSDQCVISRRDRQILFSNIGHIKDISEEFLKDLEDRWQESCYIKDICDIIHKHASHNFEPYVRYCGNQAFQDRAINVLRMSTDFNEAVRRLEQHRDCQFLPLPSFLLLPMQRITRLPLLVDAVCHRLEPGSPAQVSAKTAMDSLIKVAKRCDDAAKKMQQTEQICMLKSNLEFKVKEFPLISASRFLLKQGELTLIKAEGTGRKSFSKLLSSNKEHVYLFLFNDILLVTKRKGSIFQVRDYCQRNSVHVESVDNLEKSHHIPAGTTTGVPNILFLAMLANHENRQVEMIMSCKSESERTRWIDAITPTHLVSEAERIYDCWDCPQFHCVRKYIAQQPDELNLEESDVINVTRKMADGWYEGERIRDGQKGWFPCSHTEEINNSHVRARNLRLRYRLMRASQEYSQMELLKK